MIRIRRNERRMLERGGRLNGDGGVLSLVLVLATKIVIDVDFNCIPVSLACDFFDTNGISYMLASMHWIATLEYENP